MTSWIEREDGYTLLFNRDELRNRPRALPPRRFDSEGVAWLAPVDAAAGGSWLAVNQHGLGVGLLNGDQAVGRERPADAPSRGTLVSALAPSATLAEALARFETTRLTSYLPFKLLLLEPGGEPLLLLWSGERLSEPQRPELPLSSSSLDPARVRGARRAVWSRLVGGEPTRDQLLELHRSHLPERGPLSPCMHRPEARTHSLSLVEVDAERVSLAYADGPPCSSPLTPPLELARVTGRRAASR